ncbi:MAG: hypothetical protein H0T97_06145 [Actinobacteria bacterium]|nr:hypothetical protein [Actinomycetota bacterium]
MSVDTRSDSAEAHTLDAATEAALAALAGKLDRAEGWKPEIPGERVAGVAEAWETVEPHDDPKKRCEVLTLRTGKGLVAVWTYNKQLKTKLIRPDIDTQREAEAVPYSERLVQVADLVALEFVGKFPHPVNEGQTYARYRVEISRPVSGGEPQDDGIPY